MPVLIVRQLILLFGRLWGDAMDKPLSMRIRELRQGICDLVNDSGLPISVIELVVSDVYGEVQVVSNKMYEQDMANFSSEENNKQ